eukprot:12065488-Prorocentrum_lima.AAC.2
MQQVYEQDAKKIRWPGLIHGCDATSGLGAPRYWRNGNLNHRCSRSFVLCGYLPSCGSARVLPMQNMIRDTGILVCSLEQGRVGACC